MIKQAFVVFLLLSFCGLTFAVAEDVPYAEYRFLKDVGQIQIMTGSTDRSPDIKSRTPALEKNGIVVLETYVGHTFKRKEQVGIHQVETMISIAPPVGHGEGGGSSNVDLKVIMDRDTLVDCSLWFLDRISIDPMRRFITLNGHNGIVHFDGFESRKIIDDDWLAERAQSTQRLIVGGDRAHLDRHNKRLHRTLACGSRR